MKRIALLVVLAACERESHATAPAVAPRTPAPVPVDAAVALDHHEHAVGTYIGGGSVLFGPDPCTYAAEPKVLDTRGAEPGPRFVYAPGRITKTCGESTEQIVAIVATSARIEGPAHVSRESDRFHAHLVANDRELDGEASLEWELGGDCEGRARFGAVLGATDTGGRDRSRTLIPVGGKGTCTLVARLVTGSILHESFRPQSFQAMKAVTIH